MGRSQVRSLRVLLETPAAQANSKAKMQIKNSKGHFRLSLLVWSGLVMVDGF